MWVPGSCCCGSVMPSGGGVGYGLLMGPKGAFFSNSVSGGYTGHSPERATGTIYLIRVTALSAADELEGAGVKSGTSPHHQMASHERGQWPPLPFLLPDFRMYQEES